MTESYDLTKLDANSFEHLINLLALHVLGSGSTGFGPGSDGGRDGYFEGEAPYPSATEHWSGRWYIQSKFHKPHLSKDPQKWLLDCIRAELKEFKDSKTKREWPDIWIVATNIDPSGTPMTGAFDRAKALVTKARPKLKDRFHIWGGSKVLDLLTLHKEVAERYGQFLTPGHVLTAFFEQIKDAQAEVDTILRHLIVKQFGEQQYTKLEQAGSASDTRPGLHRLFIDIPFRSAEFDLEGSVAEYLGRTAAKSHKADSTQLNTKVWRSWIRHPTRARIWFVKGGPGQGKSTVGQYYCQIQRSALILEEDGPRVTPQQKALATEIRQAAEKMSLWPTVPRIPISIELKDFAQWFGQRDVSSARGVLTYLGERISAAVEQKVLVGTLKRALRSGSWFIVFDGLDEVPHDVKDGVAHEVKHFVDNIAVENDIDLLTLCTSRPQGYSGQFDELDGPTIDLVGLSPSQALQCAEPVLKFGRSEEEALKSFQVLQSAIQSDSVRELMTTPLQSHIMAVVVRDGGRPPERRWQLFTNFYQVIKKRETNRNLPDRKLAKLLREDEQLLKTVHNRLGFVLHARAETSKGAQTHLERSEFEVVVKSAVIQMKDFDVDDTVNVLMEAAIERLVLVSTPDDGNHVRFDIRPLQEFFAAEFIYESVNAEELRQRIELIAGDSHWREVMHFLLSALVENGRRTELSVAVEVLEHINEGDGGIETRVLRRRLGKGALLATRLLQEGVLEQDKRIRQQFRRCLEPLVAITDASVFHPLTHLSQPSSHYWLVDFLIEALREANYSENIGAALLLTSIMPDDYEHVEEVKKLIISSPNDYLCTILESRLRFRLHQYSMNAEKPRLWFINLVLGLLLAQEWYKFGGKCLRYMFNFLSEDKDKVLTLGNHYGLTATHVELLKGLLERQEYMPDRDESQTRDVTKHGVVNATHYECDWTTKSFNFGPWVNFVPDDASSAPGVLQLVFRVLRFGSTGDLSHLASMTEYIDLVGASTLRALPGHIQAFVPVDFRFDLQLQIDELKSFTGENLKSLFEDMQLSSFVLSRPYFSINIANEWTDENWQITLERFPQLFVYLWSDGSRRHGNTKKLTTVDQRRLGHMFIDKCTACPDLLRQYPNLWGKLLELGSPHTSELRNLLLGVSTGSVEDNRGWTREFFPFRLNLPLEAPLLPHILNSILLTADFMERTPQDRGLQEPARLIRCLVPIYSQLENVVSDLQLHNDIRAAALVMLLMHRKSRKDVARYQAQIVDFYDPTTSFWYLNGLTICLKSLISEDSSEATSIVGGLLNVTRTDYAARAILQQILAHWRESSRGVVNRANVQEQWLSGM